MASSSSILEAFPEYGTTSHLDALRHAEYGYLDDQGHAYLDYTGSGLAARAQHRAHAQRQADLVLGNPHSASPTSELATDLVEQTRARVLRHFNADPSEYAAVFTPNATGAARLIGEAYRFRKGKAKGSRFPQKLVLTADNHNSLNGLREYARRAGVDTTYVPCRQPDLDVNPALLLAALGPKEPSPNKAKKIKTTKRRRGQWRKFLSGVSCGLLGSSKEEEEEDEEKTIESGSESEKTKGDDHDHAFHRGLLAYPAQSNFSGVRHPLAWVAEAQRRGYDVLLDAAAYLPTSPLDLSVHHPDFVLVSWYKLFGYPTGVGCLVARREALARLDRPWFSGGTIRAVSVGLDWHAPAHRLEARFEDGTVNFQAIPDVLTGLDWLADDVGFDLLQTRVRCLTSWFLQRLLALRHTNGQPMVVLYGPEEWGNGERRGATVTFNLLDPAGNVVDERHVAAAAAAARVSLRTGCFCNPGAGELALRLSHKELKVLQRLAANSQPGGGHGHSHSEKAVDNSDPSSSSSRRDSFVSGRADSAKQLGVSDASAVASPKSSATSLAPVRVEPPPVAAAAAQPEGDEEEWPIAGAVRVSFGVASNTDDVDRFFAFAEKVFRDRSPDSTRLPPRNEC